MEISNIGDLFTRIGSTNNSNTGITRAINKLTLDSELIKSNY